MKIKYDSNIGVAFGMTAYAGPRAGIELEYEDANTGSIVMSDHGLWRATTDHSLRNGGLEFVSQPIAPTQMNRAMEQMASLVTKSKGRVTKRCGLHVHVNMTDLNFANLWAMSTYYALVEPFIFKEFADGREDSHFCVPTWANAVLQNRMYNDAVKLYRGFSKVSRSQYTGLGKWHPIPLDLLSNAKYAAMNYTSLETFGTVEFRQHPATTSTKVVRRWVEFLLNLRSESLQYDDAEAVIDEFEKNGYANLCGALGLPQSRDTNPDYIEDAVDAAYIMVGHRPTDQNDLNWEIQ